MADDINPAQAGIQAQSSPASVMQSDERFIFTQQVFEISDRVSRLDERAVSQKEATNKLESRIGELITKVDVIARDFGYIRKVWWVLLIALGVVLRETFKFLGDFLRFVGH